MNFALFMLSGMLTGQAMALSRFYHFWSVAVIAAYAIAGAIQLVQVLRWKRELREERAEMLADIEAKVKECYPGDPMSAARVISQIRQRMQ